jgi:hypothetical protein
MPGTEFPGRQMLVSDVQFGASPTRFNQYQRKRKWNIWNVCDVSFSNELSNTEFHDDTRIRYRFSRISTRIRVRIAYPYPYP